MSGSAGFGWIGGLTVALALGCVPLAGQGTAPAAPPALPAAAGDPRATVLEAYALISGAAGEARDWERFRAVFHPDARFIFPQRDSAGVRRMRVATVEEFIRVAEGAYRAGAGFWERETGSRMDRFGAVAQVFSAYETRRAAPDGPVVARGINSFQLVQEGGRWRIVSLAWDQASAEQPIPAEFLPAGSE